MPVHWRPGRGSPKRPSASLPNFRMPDDIKSQYAGLVAAAEIERDPAQERVLDLLAALEARLREHRLARKSSSLGWLFGARERREQPIRGLYLVGAGFIWWVTSAAAKPC